MAPLRLFSFLSILIFFSSAWAKTVQYELVVRNEPVNMSGQRTVDFALTVNGGIPAPTLEFTEGDEAEILVKNELADQEVSIHWHGILLPPEEDGVAYVNTPPIHPGTSRLFKFRIRQHGTYWYHSHTGLQEQKGVFGAFIIHPKKKTIKSDKEAVVILSDWSDENADQILRNLRKDGDYYLYKKNSMRSYLGALQTGGLQNHLVNEWTRMGGMDLSDVGYDAFLINGKRGSQLLTAHPGEKIRLRIINAGASSYFYVSLAGLPMTVVSADGVDIEPIQAKELLMGMAETYDVLFTVPEHKNYELRATVQDVTGQASTWIGMGEKVAAPDKPAPDMYASMDHGSHSDSTTSEEPHVETLTVDSLRSSESTRFSKDFKVHDVKLVLDGDMSRYIWHINGKAIHEDRLLHINKDEVVRFTFVNATMMHHPMHFHGHFFRVLNKNGDHSPLKHTVDVAPHETKTIEFLANEPGQWMLHCHNLYHMKTGMARVVRYSDYKLTPEMEKNDKLDPHLHDHLYTYSMLEAASNHAQANFKLMRTWDEWDLRIEAAEIKGKNFSFGRDWEAEGDLVYRHWFSKWLNVFGGGTLYHEQAYGTVGVGYILPMLIESAISVNHQGKFRLDLEKRLQWTKTVFSDVEYTWRPEWKGERDSEFEISLMYSPSWSWAAGLMLTEKNLGAGLQVQF